MPRMMEEGEIRMHLRAAKAAGRKSACGYKIQHSTLESAESHAHGLNQRPEVISGEKPRSEPYPCPWCSPSLYMDHYYYHVGRALTPEEREKYATD